MPESYPGPGAANRGRAPHRSSARSNPPGQAIPGLCRKQAGDTATTGLPEPGGTTAASGNAHSLQGVRATAYPCIRPPKLAVLGLALPSRSCERMFVTSQGSAYGRFKKALAQGNPLIALASARELPRLSLADALALLLVLRSDPDLYHALRRDSTPAT